MDTSSKYTVENSRLCRRVRDSIEENKDSNTSEYAFENQKSSQIVPNTDIIQNKVNQHTVCEVVDRCGNVVIPQEVVLLDVVDILFDIVDEVIVVVVVDVVIVDIVTVVVVGIVTVAVEVLEIVDSGVLVSDVKLSVIDPSEINQEL